MQLSVTPKMIGELEEANGVMQSPFWGRLKQRAGWRPRCFALRSELGDSDLLALARPPGDPVPHLYVPHGPQIDLPSEVHGPFLEALSEQLRSHLGGGCIFVRYDLPWESPYGVSDGAEQPAPRVRELRMNFATRRWNLYKSPTDIQPADTVQLDPQKEDAELLGSMKSKTRYNVRLSARRGVKVGRGEIRDLPAWYEIYRDTSTRKGIFVADRAYFKALVTLAAADAGTKAAFLVARYGGELIGGILVAADGAEAIYLYGATSYAHRHLMSSYALQWEAVRWARGLGCRVYDLHGIPPNQDLSHPMHGLYRFKTGFGGRKVHRRGCWDYPYKQARYRSYGGREAAAPGFHLSGRSG